MEPIIPIIDFNLFRTNAKFALKQLEEAFHKTGFFCLKNHGMDLKVIAAGELSFKQFLTDLSLEDRNKYSFPEKHYQIGYTPPKIEKGEFAKNADEKHFFHVFPADMTPVSELPNFLPDTVKLWYEFDSLAEDLMKYIALSLGQSYGFFKSADGAKGYSLLRGLHYPAGPKPATDENVEIVEGGNVIGMCASKHTDINCITLLLAKEPGLQLWHEGEWVPITITDPDLIIVNCGDMLQHLTNGYYRSALHRVVCEENKERFSIPFFYHPADSFNIRPLVSEKFGPAKPEYRYETAGEYLKVRLAQIGLLN